MTQETDGSDAPAASHSPDTSHIIPPSKRAPSEVPRFAWLKKARERMKKRWGRKTFNLDAEPMDSIKVLIVSDAWKPQLNGVVRTLDTLGKQLEGLGNEVRYITPDLFKSVPLPTYSEIRLALLPNRKMRKIINDFQPDAIHIATEGPLGWAARRFCLRRDHPFTTSFHTRFPEYVNARIGLPIDWGYKVQRVFHRPASCMMVTTPALMTELEERGFGNLRIWSRGVDTEQFRIMGKDFLSHLPRPIWLYVGRIAVEKNLESFLNLPLEGTKLMVGDGPQLEELKQKFPDAVFTGAKFGDELAQHYSASDVFVFPSKTDTFGLVNVEALACGIPVAAFPVTGPREIIGEAKVGVLSEDLEAACRGALGIATPEECRAHAMNFSWEAGTKQFIQNLAIPGFDEAYWLESANFPDDFI
ncbi:MAG: glycosyltransferase family 1 protein [Pseudomonadota bacterium]